MLDRHWNPRGVLRNAIPELLDERNTLLLRSFVEASRDSEGWCSWDLIICLPGNQALRANLRLTPRTSDALPTYPENHFIPPAFAACAC